MIHLHNTEIEQPMKFAVLVQYVERKLFDLLSKNKKDMVQKSIEDSLSLSEQAVFFQYLMLATNQSESISEENRFLALLAYLTSETPSTSVQARLMSLSYTQLMMIKVYCEKITAHQTE